MGDHRRLETRLRMHEDCTYEIAMPAEYFQDTIRNQLCSLLEEDALKDIKIILRTRSVDMSSCILSLLSPVLRRMVCGCFRESIRKEIRLDDVEAEVLFKLLMLACGKDGLIAANAKELFELGQLAERLQMDAVRVVVEGKLLEELKVENCVAFSQWSEASGLELLQKECYKMLRDQFEIVSKKEWFVTLSEETIGNLLEEDELWVDREEQVFDVLMKWMTNNNEGMSGDGLLRKIRYGVMSNEYLVRLMSLASLPENGAVKELLGETIAKIQGGKSEGVWDGVERLCDKWKVARTKARIIGADVLEHPEFVALDAQGRLVVTDTRLNEIIVFNRDGSVARRLGSSGEGIGEFHYLAGVAVDRQGHIIVADFGNNRIQVLKADESVVRCFGSAGNAVGELDGPCGVAIDREGHIVVVEKCNHRVQVFDADGSVVRHFGSEGAAIGQLKFPRGVAVDGAGRIVVADKGNHRVQVFNGDGTVALCFGSEGHGPGQLKGPYGVAVDSGGRFVVAEFGNHRVQVFNSDGSAGQVIGSVGDGEGQLRQPKGVVVDEAGLIMVAEGASLESMFNNHRVKPMRMDNVGPGEGEQEDGV